MLPPDPDDVAQEVELQRLLGRSVTPRFVAMRMRRDEARRARAERERAGCDRDTATDPPDPVRYPLLAERLAGGTVADMCGRLGIGRQALSRRVREELDAYLGGR